MKNKIIKAVLFFIVGILAIVLGLFIALWVISPGKPQPIMGPDGKPLEGSISTKEKISLGGVDQYIIIRGADSSKPVMLFLHGGPGSPEIAFMKQYNTDIEKDFVMVYWEQRGSGKSYSKDVPRESMTLDQFVSDTRELCEYLIERFNQDNIFLMGHSWGSLLGTITAFRHPELFKAYFGIGQVANQFEGERIGYEWVKQQAMERNDKKAIKTLSRLSFPDSLAGSDLWLDYLTKQRQYVNRYGGGTTREITGMWPLISIVLKTREYTVRDKLNFMVGSMFSLRAMWDEVINTNLFKEIDSMQLPVYILHGVHDYTTPYAVAKAFYEQLQAPEKAFFSFEHSAHSPVMEEVEKFNAIVRGLAEKY